MERDRMIWVGRNSDWAALYRGSRCYVVLGLQKRWGSIVTSGHFLKKGTPGFNLYVAILRGKLKKCDLP